LDAETDRVRLALHLGRIHAPAVRTDGEERLSDRARIVRAEAGEESLRDLAPALLDRRRKDFFRPFCAERCGELVEEQSVAVGAMAECRFQLAGRGLDALLVVHRASDRAGRRGCAATRALAVADCGFSTTSCTGPVSTIAPRSITAT